MSVFEPVNLENFDESVLHSKIPVLVEFGAVWCGPCKRMEPELEKFHTKAGLPIRIGKIDVDESPDLAMQYSVMSVPTLILFVEGQPLQRLSGFQPLQRMEDVFLPHLA